MIGPEIKVKEPVKIWVQRLKVEKFVRGAL